MAFTINAKDGLDIPDWRPLAVAPSASASGCSLIGDLRNNEDRHHEIFQLASASVLNAYHTKNDGWATTTINPGLAGTFGVGASGIFSTRGPRGTIAAGATTTTVILSTALPAAVGVNMLSGRGDKRGFKIRIIDNGAGGSGKIEERLIVGNSAGTTPTVILDSALSFTPVTGSAYEFLSGRVYLLNAGTTAAGIFKAFDILTNSMLANLSTTNLPATIGTDSSFEMLDEMYVPYNRSPGEGFLVGAGTYNGGLYKCLTATGIAAGTITGEAAAGDYSILANEYRNFQIRIVEDTVNPTAVGQRRLISSHTAGASPVYTLSSNWTVTPSANCKYVLENPNYLLLWTSGSASTFTYAQDAIGSMTADTWNTTQFVALSATSGAGCSSFQTFGLVPDSGKNVRHSHILIFRGAGTSTMYRLDIAAGATGTMATETYGSIAGALLTTGTSVIYDPVCNEGKFAYMIYNGSVTFYRFNAYARQLNQWTQLRFAQSTTVVGQRVALKTCVDTDGSVLTELLTLRSTGTEFFGVVIQR